MAIILPLFLSFLDVFLSSSLVVIVAGREIESSGKAVGELLYCEQKNSYFHPHARTLSLTATDNDGRRGRFVCTLCFVLVHFGSISLHMQDLNVFFPVIILLFTVSSPHSQWQLSDVCCKFSFLLLQKTCVSSPINLPPHSVSRSFRPLTLGLFANLKIIQIRPCFQIIPIQTPHLDFLKSKN